MWCSRCQQDVPGVASQQRICCARCGEGLTSGYATPKAETGRKDAAATSPASKSPHERISVDATPPVDLDDWKLDDDLRTAARLVKSLRGSGALHRDAFESEAAFPPELASSTLPGWHAASSAGSFRADAAHSPPREQVRQRPRRRGAFFSWTMLSLGLMMFVCGGVLLGWSMWSGRGELWSLGFPLILAGQAALIVGLVFQLDGLWQNNRETSQTLEQLDDQLNDLQHAATMLGTTHSSGARSFYAHMAEGASPQMLLTDLKGQMDLLAVRLAQTQRKR